jgi:hypothetical protein
MRTLHEYLATISFELVAPTSIQNPASLLQLHMVLLPILNIASALGIILLSESLISIIISFHVQHCGLLDSLWEQGEALPDI